MFAGQKTEFQRPRLVDDKNGRWARGCQSQPHSKSRSKTAKGKKSYERCRENRQFDRPGRNQSGAGPGHRNEEIIRRMTREDGGPRGSQ